MFQTTKGLVLRETEYRDNDKILTVLTGDSGLMTLRAWGVKRKCSPLKSACQLLTYSEFTVREKQGFCSVQEANAIEMFTALRNNIELLSLASYFAQATEVLAQEDAPDPQLLSLILYALKALCAGKAKELVKAAFELRLAVLSGYQPELSACSICGCETADRFHVSHGELQCASCRREGFDGILMPVSPGTRDAMRYVSSYDVSKVFSFTLGEESLREFAGIAEAYLLTQLERGFYTLDFYKSLLLT